MQKPSILLPNKDSVQISLQPIFKHQTKRIIKTWTPDEDQLLFQLYDKYPKQWTKIANSMNNRNQNQCLHRFRRLNQEGGKSKKIWSQEEDNLVKSMVQKFGCNWRKIAANVKTKTGKQIRQRYVNSLDPKINKKPWSQLEDQKLIELYTKHGSRWSEISRNLPGRPQNRIKNRFYCHILKNYNIYQNNPKITGNQTIQKNHQSFGEHQNQNNTQVCNISVQSKVSPISSSISNPLLRLHNVQQSIQLCESFEGNQYSHKEEKHQYINNNSTRLSKMSQPIYLKNQSQPMNISKNINNNKSLLINECCNASGDGDDNNWYNNNNSQKSIEQIAQQQHNDEQLLQQYNDNNFFNFEENN